MDLRNSVALLTGASRGIGPHIARALVREGAHVAVAARSLPALEAVAAGFARAPPTDPGGAIGLHPGSRLGGTCARLALERRCEVPWPTDSDSCFPA